MKISEAYVEIGARLSKLRTGLRTAEVSATNWSTRISTRITTRVMGAFNRLGGVIERMSGKLRLLGLVGVAAMGLLAKSSIQAAVALERQDALFEITLKTRAPAMRKWSEDLAKRLQLSASETRKFTGNWYLMLRGLGLGEQAAQEMAKGLTEIGYGVSFLRGLSPDEMYRKMASGMVGMTRPLLDIGISTKELDIRQTMVTKGMIKQTEKLTELGKLYARYIQLVDATKDDQEALARELGTTHVEIVRLSAAWGDLKEAIGESILGGGGGEFLSGLRLGMRGIEKQLLSTEQMWSGVWGMMGAKAAETAIGILEWIDRIQLGLRGLAWTVKQPLEYIGRAADIVGAMGGTTQYAVERFGAKMRGDKAAEERLWKEQMRASEQFRRQFGQTPGQVWQYIARPQLFEGAEEGLARLEKYKALKRAAIEEYKRASELTTSGEKPSVPGIKGLGGLPPEAVEGKGTGKTTAAIDWARLGTSQRAKEMWARLDAEKQSLTEQQKANDYLRQILEEQRQTNTGYGP